MDQDFDPKWIGARIGKAEWHFHRQLFERYGIVLGVAGFSDIVMKIRSGRARLIKAKGRRGGIYAVRIKGAQRRVYVLAFDGIPRTAWPPKDGTRLLRDRGD